METLWSGELLGAKTAERMCTMRGVVTQLPVRDLGLGVRVWGLCLQLLSLGLWALQLCLLLLLRRLFVCVQRVGRAVLTVARSVALTVHVCAVYILLQGVAWCAQLVGSWVTLHLWLFAAFLETFRRIPLTLVCEQAARWLVQAAVWASRGLAWVQCIVTFVWPCARMVFLGMYLCMHICFSTISSKVHVRVHMPFNVSLPFKVHAPLSLGLKVGLQERAKVRRGVPQREVRKDQRPRRTRSPKSMRKREPAPSRSEFNPVVPSAATLIIVVCVGFLVLMVILGLVRIHSLHRRVSGASGPPGASSDPKDPDLFWDDSALTIIVNPMESYQNRQACVAGTSGGQQEDEDSSDSEAADSPSSDERRIIETPPHRY